MLPRESLQCSVRKLLRWPLPCAYVTYVTVRAALQEHNVCVHYAALSALSCVHEDVKHYQAGAMLEAAAPETLRTLVALLPHYTKRNVRQALETLIQIVRAVPICMEDPDIIKARLLQHGLRLFIINPS